MDSSKIISLEDLAKKENRYPGEEEALEWALRLCDLVQGENGLHPMLSPRNIYVENGGGIWSTAHPPVTQDPSEALFRLGSVLHYLLTRNPFQISHYLDGPPSIRDRNPQISVRLEAIVMRLLQNIRSLRYSTIPELKEDLVRLQKELSGDWTAHWSCFKGNNLRTSAIQDPAFQPAGKILKEVWKANIGDIWASPVLAGESVFVGSGNGNFYCIDSKTGKTVWKLSLGARIESSAAIQGSSGYVGNDLGYFYAINIKNGSNLWKKNLGEYVRSSPCVMEDHVYAGSINPTQKVGTLWCLSAETGSTVWKKNVGPIFSSPVCDKGDVILGSDDENLYCFNNTEKWRVALVGKIRSTAAIMRDFVYVGGFGGVFFKIRKSTGEIIWQSQDAGAMYSSPAIGRGFIAVGNNAGSIGFFQPGTGKKVAEFATGGPVTATPLIVGQYVLVGSNDGKFYVLDSKGAEVCSFDAKSPINSSACYHDHTIFIGSDSGLHALSF